MKWLSLSILLLIKGFTASAQNTEDKADSLFMEGDIEEALQYYEKLVEEDNNNADYIRKRGSAYIALDQFEKGRSDYMRSLEIDPECSKCYSSLARLNAFNGKIDTALKLVNIAIEKSDTNDFAYFLRAKIKSIQGQNFDAIDDFNKAIELSPNEAIYYAERGNHYMNNGLSSNALEDLNKAVSLDSSNVQLVYRRSQTYVQFQMWENALNDLNRCIVLDGENAVYYRDKAAVLDFLDLHEKSLENYNISISLDSANYFTYMNRAIVLYKLEDMDGACADKRMALELIEKPEENHSIIKTLRQEIEELCDPEKKSYYYHRGIAAYNLGKFEKAIEYYNQMLAKFPNSPMLLLFRGNAYKALGKHVLAVDDYKAFLQNKKDFMNEIRENPRFRETNAKTEHYESISVATTYGSLAESYASVQEYQTAMIYADSAITLLLQEQRNGEVKSLLSNSYVMRSVVNNVMGNTDEAKSDIKKAIIINENNPLAYINKAIILISDKKAVQYESVNMGLYVNAGYTGRQGVTIPIVKKKKVDKSNLLLALEECNKAIRLKDDLAFAYLIRAQIKVLLDQFNYCSDILKAQELGIENAMELLGVKCE